MHSVRMVPIIISLVDQTHDFIIILTEQLRNIFVTQPTNGNTIMDEKNASTNEVNSVVKLPWVEFPKFEVVPIL